jgi:orotate phosphoribosyltransferase-like protein
MIVIDYLEIEHAISYPVLTDIKMAKILMRDLSFTLKQKYVTDKFAFICMGNSGIVLSTLLSHHCTNSHIMYVKKDCELNSGHHRGRIINSFYDPEYTYIIVDDIVETGNTLFELRSHIRDFNERIKISSICICGTGINRKLLKQIEDMINPEFIFKTKYI